MNNIKLFFLLLFITRGVWAMQPNVWDAAVGQNQPAHEAAQAAEPGIEPEHDGLEAVIEHVEPQELAFVPMTRADWVQAAYRVGQHAVNRWHKRMCSTLVASECFAQAATHYGCGSRLCASAYQAGRLGTALAYKWYIDRQWTPHIAALTALRGALLLGSLWSLVRQPWSLFGFISPLNSVNATFGAIAGCFFETVAHHCRRVNQLAPTHTTRTMNMMLPLGLAGFQLYRLVK